MTVVFERIYRKVREHLGRFDPPQETFDVYVEVHTAGKTERHLGSGADVDVRQRQSGHFQNEARQRFNGHVALQEPVGKTVQHQSREQHVAGPGNATSTNNRRGERNRPTAKEEARNSRLLQGRGHLRTVARQISPPNSRSAATRRNNFGGVVFYMHCD